MSYGTRYDNGDWKADCDVCGRTYKASQLQKRWDGLMCCHQDWEIRQPQDFVRGVADNQTVPWSRPEPADSFIPITTYQGMTNSGPVTSSATLVPLVIYAPYHLYITRPVVATLSYFIVPPATVTALNGSAINIKTLG